MCSEFPSSSQSKSAPNKGLFFHDCSFDKPTSLKPSLFPFDEYPFRHVMMSLKSLQMTDLFNRFQRFIASKQKESFSPIFKEGNFFLRFSVSDKGLNTLISVLQTQLLHSRETVDVLLWVFSFGLFPHLYKEYFVFLPQPMWDLTIHPLLAPNVLTISSPTDVGSHNPPSFGAQHPHYFLPN